MDVNSIVEKAVADWLKEELKMRQDIIEYLQKEIKRKCELPSNFFGMGCFYHIRAVADNVPSLLYLAYVKRNLGIDEGKDSLWILAFVDGEYEGNCSFESGEI